MSEELLTTAEVKKILRVSGPTVATMVHDGRLEGFKIGIAGKTSAWRIKKESVDRFMKE